jgi:hypothetical protein
MHARRRLGRAHVPGGRRLPVPRVSYETTGALRQRPRGPAHGRSARAGRISIDERVALLDVDRWMNVRSDGVNLRTEPIAAGPHRVRPRFSGVEGPARDPISPLDWSLA